MAYAQAASEAAPGAVQVADRWHLLGNMRDVLERALQQRSTAICGLLARVPAGNAAGSAAGGTSDRAPDPEGSGARARRQVRFDEVKQMHAEGHSLRGIAAALGLHYRTIERYVRSDACPDWCAGHRRPSAWIDSSRTSAADSQRAAGSTARSAASWRRWAITVGRPRSATMSDVWRTRGAYRRLRPRPMPSWRSWGRSTRRLKRLRLNRKRSRPRRIVAIAR